MGRRTKTALKKAPVIEEPAIEIIEEPVSQVPRCSVCREPLTQIAWNTSCDMLICENLSCVRWRQPQGSIAVPYRSMEQVMGRAPRTGSRNNHSLL